MNLSKLLMFLQTLVFSLSVLSQELETPPRSSLGFSLRTESTLPLFLGAGFGFSPHEKMDLALYFGLTPEPYYRIIGKTAASMGGNAAYEDVIVAAFQNNSVQKAVARYYFDKKGSGWSLGLSGYLVASSGQAPINTVLTAATGRDYSSLITLLNAAGRPTQVEMKGSLSVFEIHGGYEHEINSSSKIHLFLGLAKVFKSEVQLKTGLTTFESTQVGQNLMRQSESDLEKIIVDNGISPTLGFEYHYNF